MDKQYFKNLLRRYLYGEVTIEEKQFLESYYELFETEQNDLDSLNEEEKKELENDLIERIWSDISVKESGGAKIRAINKRFIRVAAAAVFAGIISTLFFFYQGPQNNQHSITADQRSKSELKSSSGKILPLHQNENKVIFLPDGSTVFLSPGSRLNYPSTFDGLRKREVYLQGQGFFDIKHNASKPFIVHTGQVATTVLGTAFNIKAQPDEKLITVTVKRGRVSVSDPHKTLGIITPREQITYDKEKETSSLSTVTSDSYLDWKYGDLFIDNLTLAEAAKLLEEQYKIKIIIKDSSLREQRFTATFPKNETLEVAVKSISEFNGLSYSINRDKSIVTINNPKK